MWFLYEPTAVKKWEDSQIGSLCAEKSWFEGKYSHTDEQQAASPKATTHKRAKLQTMKPNILEACKQSFRMMDTSAAWLNKSCKQ